MITMHMRCIVKSLRAAVETAAHLVANRSTLPILGNILVDVAISSATITSTDVDIHITASLLVTCVRPGKITVSPAALLHLLRRLPDESTIDLQENNEHLFAQAGGFRLELPTLPASDFPLAPQWISISRFTIPGTTLCALFDTVSHCISTEETRYYLNGACLHISPSGRAIRVVATDGHRMAIDETYAPEGSADLKQIIVSQPTVKLVRSLFRGEAGVSVCVMEAGHSPRTQIAFQQGDISISAKLIDGKFPDYERVIPSSEGKPRATFERAHLLHAIDMLSCVMRHPSDRVDLMFSDGKLILSAAHPDIGVARMELRNSWSVEARSIGFQTRYLRQVLEQIGPSIDMVFSDQNAPAVLTSPARPRQTFLLMPMRT